MGSAMGCGCMGAGVAGRCWLLLGVALGTELSVFAGSLSCVMPGGGVELR